MAQTQSLEHKSLRNSIASNIDPVTAARNFTDPTTQILNAGASESDLESSLRRAWNSLIDVAANTEHHSQQPLVDIVRAVQQQSLTREDDSSTVEIWGERVEVWKDLPLFGPAVREAWNRAPGSGSQDDFSAKQWRNINAFLARLTHLSPSVPAFDFSLYAIWTLRSAFESTGEVAPADLDAANMWFVYARDVLERFSREGKAFDGKVARGGSKFLDMDWKGFNPQRFEIWQNALQ